MGKRKSGIITAAKIFTVIGAIMTSIMTYGIGLFWCIPMTVHYFNSIGEGKHIGTGFKVCSIFFVSQLGGIFMLCDDEADLKNQKTNINTQYTTTSPIKAQNYTPNKPLFGVPYWLKVGENVTHKTLGEVTIKSIDDEWITIVDVNGVGYKLNLEYCVKNETFSNKNNKNYFTNAEKISDFSQPFQVGDIVNHLSLGKVTVVDITGITVTVTDKNNSPRTFAIKDFAENVLQVKKNKISLDDKPEQENQNKEEIKTMEKLIANKWKQLGTNSQKIYLDCCKKYGWKEELASKLGHQGSLQFVINATNENYDVWFITHSNLNDSKTTRWENEVSEDLSKIIEYNTAAGEEAKIKAHKIRKNLRIVFAKTRSTKGEGYAFLGVYKLDTRTPLYNNPDYVAKYVYKQVSKEYPIEKSIIEEPPVTIPDWLKIGEMVQHKLLEKVRITELNEKNISIMDEDGVEHNLDLTNCLRNKVFSPIKQDPPQTTDLPTYVFIGNKALHSKYGEVEILSIADEFIFIQDSNKRVYYIKKEDAFNKLKPLVKFESGTTIVHKGLGKVQVTKVTETSITVIDKNGELHLLDLKTCFEKGLLSNE